MAQNTPIIRVSSTRKAIMYSATRRLIDFQLARIASGMRKVVSSTNRIESPSTPMR